MVPAHDDSDSPFLAIEGLDAILNHLCDSTKDAGQLTNSLTDSKSGEVLALSSHLQARLWPLIALSLFVSSANYASATRPSFGSTLSFPESWMLPHKSHRLATASCAHLGIESKDLDLLVDELAREQTNGLADAGPFTSDEIPNDQNSGKKVDPSIATRIKLRRRIDELVYAALAPFVSDLELPTEKETLIQPNSKDMSSPDAKASKPRWLFSAPHPTLADLTALSLLSLAVLPYCDSPTGSVAKKPSLTNTFLPSSINRQFPNLISSYLVPGLQDAFGGRTLPENSLTHIPPAASRGNIEAKIGQIDIPWRQTQSRGGLRTMQRVGITFGSVFADAIGLR